MDKTDNQTKEQLLKEIELLRSKLEKAQSIINLIENSNDIIFKYSLVPEPHWEFINNAVTKITGYTPADCYKDPELVWKMIHPDDKGLAEKTFYIKGRDERSNDIRWITKEGRIIWMEQINTPIFDEQGRLIAIQGIKRDITEHKFAEQRIAESEERFKGIVERTFNVVLLINPKGYITYASPSIYENSLFKPEEVIGKNIKEFISKTDLSIAFSKLDEVFRGGEVKGFVLSVFKKDGSLINIELNASPIIKDNEINEIQVIYKDITKFIEIERIKTEGAEFYKKLFKYNNLPMFIIDPDNLAIVDANIKACLFYGYSREKFTTLTLLDINLRTKEEITFDRDKTLADNINFIKVKHILSSGDIRDVEIYVTTILKEGKIFLYSIIHDVTERKKIENELKEGRNMLQSIMDNSPSAIFIKNVKGQYILINRNFEKMFSLKSSDVLNKLDLDFMPEKIAKLCMERDRCVFENGEIIETEEVLTYKDKLCTYLTVKFPLYDSNGLINGLCAMSSDITDKKRFEQRILKELKINQTFAKLTEHLLGRKLDTKGISKLILDEAMELTQSGHGFTGEIDSATGDAIAHTLTDMLDKECKLAKELDKISFPKGRDGYNGLWGYALNTLKGFYTNNPAEHVSYKGCIPEGHIKLHNYLSVPVLLEGALIGQIAVANSIRDYTDEDLLIIERLAVLFAVAIEREKADIALKKSEFLFKTQFNVGNIGITIYPLDKGFSVVNKKLSSITGYSAEELSKMKWTDLCYKEDIKNGQAYFNQILKGEIDNYQREMRIVNKNGSIVNAHLTVSCYRKPDGTVDFIVSYLQDITERIKMEEALKKSEFLFKTQFEFGNIGIAITSPDKGFIEVNQKYCDIIGYNKEELSKMAWIDYSHRDDLEPGLTYFRQMLNREGNNYEFDKRLIHKNGSTIYVHLISSCYRKPDGTIDFLITYMQDITKNKEMERKITASLREKELMLGEIHHRVKNNMAVIMAILSMQRSGITDKDQLALFKEAENRIKSMAIVHEKLYRSKNLATVDFREYINSLTTELFNAYKLNNIKLSLDIKDINLEIDAAVPCGLLLNELISNSLKHAFPGGSTGEIFIGMKNIPDKRIELIVRDNGIGISRDINIRNTESIGMQLIIGFVESQLEGKLECNIDNGTEFKAIFKATPRKLEF